MRSGAKAGSGLSPKKRPLIASSGKFNTAKQTTYKRKMANRINITTSDASA